MHPKLDGFSRRLFDANGMEKTVYVIGEGPGVVLIHELPGMVPEFIDLARKLAAEGFTVYAPLLFGEPGANYGAKPLLWPCVWKEFSVLSRNGESPIADWLRALARLAHAERGGPGVGAIGMCFTGRFAISLMLEPATIAPVASQPGASWHPGAMGIPDGECAAAAKRSAEENIPVLALRFENDSLCTAARFDSLRGLFGDRLRERVFPGDKHSVLTLHFKDLSPENRARVWADLVEFLTERLKP